MASPNDDAPRGRGKKVPLIAGALVLLLGGAGVVLARERDAGAEAQAPTVVQHEPGVVALEPYVLNLMDPEGERYLRCTLRIVLDREDAAAKWNTDPLLQTRVRDRVFSLLAARTADELAAPGGREKLRERIRSTVEPLFEEARVLEVYFAEFLLQ